MNSLEQRLAVDEAAQHLGLDVQAAAPRVADVGETKPPRRSRGDGNAPIGIDASRAAETEPAVDRGGAAAVAGLQERVATLCRLLEEGRSSAHQREAEAWRAREAELERRIAAERDSGERR